MRKKLLWIFFITLLIFSISTINMIGVTVAQETHDIAIISVVPSPTLAKLDESVNITVTVANEGTSNETFDVTAYYDNTAIETKTGVFLANGTSISLIFTWNTMDVREEVYAAKNILGNLLREKNYTITATASTVLNETDTADNTLVSPSEVRVIAHYITVIPQSTVDITLEPGNNYTVSIYTDYNGSDVFGYGFALTYNPLVLEGVNVTNGDLITGTYATLWQAGEFDNENGTLSLTENGLYDPVNDLPKVTSGPGTLANVTFRVVGTGDSHITLVTAVSGERTRLIGYNATTGEKDEIINVYLPDLGHILHGYFRNTAEPVTHDIAVINVTPSNTSVVEGEPVNVTVVVENQGTVAEKFDVEVWYDYDPLGNPSFKLIGTETVSNLAAGANKTLTFTWDTTGAPAGDHKITAVASTVAGETDTEDNTCESEMVTVKRRPETPIPITELIIGTVIVVVVIAVVVYAVRRRKKPTLE